MWQRHIFASSLPPSGDAATSCVVVTAGRGAGVPGCVSPWWDADDGAETRLERHSVVP